MGHVVSTTRTQPFAARIMLKNGKKHVEFESPQWVAHQVQKFSVGDRVTVEITNKRPKRTLQQNRYYWGVYLPEIARETGEDIDSLHTLFSGKFLTTGIVKVLGESVRMKKSTAELSIGEFCEYIMNIELFTSIAAPPVENFGLAPLRNTLHL